MGLSVFKLVGEYVGRSAGEFEGGRVKRLESPFVFHFHFYCKLGVFDGELVGRVVGELIGESERRLAPLFLLLFSFSPL